MAPLDHSRQLLSHLATHLADGPGLLVDVLPEHDHGRGALEGQLARQHLVEHAPQRVDIGPDVDCLPSRLLGRHVVRGAQQGARLRHRGERLGAGDAEVGDLRGAVVADEHVLGLYVTVDDVLGVGSGQRLGDLDGELDGAVDLHRPATLDEPGQALRQVLQRDEVASVVLAYLENTDDVGVVDGGGHVRLTAEPLQVGCVSGQIGTQHP